MPSQTKAKRAKKDYMATVMLDPFCYELTVILSHDINNTLNRFGLGEMENKAGVAVALGDSSMIILDIACLDPGIIAHEAAHCIFSVLESAGQDPIKGEETFTYLLQYVVNFVMAMAKKHKVKVEI
jgi:hypothetical protein